MMRYDINYVGRIRCGQRSPVEHEQIKGTGVIKEDNRVDDI